MRKTDRTRPQRCGLGFAASMSCLLALSTPAAAQPTDAPQAAPAPQRVIVLPTVETFVDAIYPPEAAKAGIEADVILRVTVEPDGSVSLAAVDTPVGSGFDEAAVAAVKQFRFSQATVDGVPYLKPVTFKYKYSFTLSATAQPEATPNADTPDAPPPPPTIGDLGGILVIAGTKDVPLAGAKVTLTLLDGGQRETVSNPDGRWRFSDLDPGAYAVRVEVDGFDTIESKEEVIVGEETDVTYRVEPEAVGEVVVVRGTRPPREVTRRRLERREISRIPGTSGDALRSIQSLPGVARPPGLAGLLIIRGSAPQSTNTFMDGTLVPLIYHFGGLSSVVPTELIDTIDFYPGNFSARFGRVTGGVVDVALREPDTTCLADYGVETDEKGCFRGMAQVDLIDTRAVVQGPLGAGWTFAAGGRRSWVDLWLKPALEQLDAGVTTAPIYSDFQLIAEKRPSADSRISVRVYGSDDRLELLITNPSAQEPGILGGGVTFRTGFLRGQVLYTDQLTRDVELTTMLSVGQDRILFELGAIEFQLDSYPVANRTEFGWNIMPGAKLHAGYDFLLVPFDVFVRAPLPPRPGEPFPGPFTTRQLFVTENKSEGFRPAWYAELELTPSRRALITPGVRLDYTRDTSQGDFSPRIMARYDLIGGKADENLPEEARPRRTTIKGGVGIFKEPPTPQETDPVFGTPGLMSNKSTSYTLGIEQELTNQIEVSTEGYYKDLSQLVSRTPTLDGAFQYDNQGSGSVVGLETLAKYKADDRFFGWLAYTLSRSVRRNNADEEERPFQFDQTHIMTVLGSYRFGRGWEAGARFRLVSGNLTTPVARPPSLQALYVADSGSYTPLQGEPFSRRLPLFHQLDLRVEKAWQFRSWRLAAFLDVWNAYNNAAVETINYNFDFSRSAPQTGLPIIPSLGVRGEL